MQVLIVSMLVSAHPFVLAADLAQDADAQFWLGKAPIGILFLPILYLLVYIFHLQSAGPRFVGMYMSIIVPTAVFFGFGFWVLYQAAILQDKVNGGCQLNAHDEVGQLQQAWDAAATFHAECHAPLSQCDGYAEELGAKPGRRREWEYLASLERSSGCGGWCEPGPRLWGPDAASVACTDVVAHSCSKLTLGAYQFMVYAVVVLSAGLGWMCRMAPLFRLQSRQLSKDYLVWYTPSQ